MVVPVIFGDMFQDPQGMAEIPDSTEPYMHYVFFYACIPMIV